MTKWMRALLLGVASCGLLHACASVPLSTMARMSTFDEQKFAAVRAEEVGVRIRVPKGFELDVAKSGLAITLASKAGVHESRFDLEQVGLRDVEVDAGWLSGAEPGVEYELRLRGPSQDRFRELQAFVAKARADDILIRVMPKLASSPADATAVTVWIDLRLSEAEGYFALVDGAAIELSRLRK